MDWVFDFCEIISLLACWKFHGCSCVADFFPCERSSSLESGTVVFATDGSYYDRKKSPNVSGSGWVISCQRSGKILKGSIVSSQAMSAPIEGNFWAWWQIIPWFFTHVSSINPQWLQGRLSVRASRHYTNQAKKDIERSALVHLRLTCSELYNRSIKKCRG